MRSDLRTSAMSACAFAALHLWTGPSAAQDRPAPRPRTVEVTGTVTTPASDTGHLGVTVDRAKVIRLPERTQTVVIGNPAIADISVQKNGVAVLTGKSYGLTNMIALDGAGGLLAESTVTVTAPSDAVVVVQRGLDRQTYSCNPICQPSVVLGDSNGYFSETKGQADMHGQFATQR